MPHERFRVGLPAAGTWREVLNSDAEVYGGSGVGNLGRVQADRTPRHDRPYSAEIVLPPLACLFFGPVTDGREGSRAS
jgi:1,4-alpha-glucan branching enzyme